MIQFLWGIFSVGRIVFADRPQFPAFDPACGVIACPDIKIVATRHFDANAFSSRESAHNLRIMGGGQSQWCLVR